MTAMRKTPGVSISECPEGLACSVPASDYALWKKDISVERNIQEGESQYWRNWCESSESPSYGSWSQKGNLCPLQELDFSMKRSVENN